MARSEFGADGLEAILGYPGHHSADHGSSSDGSQSSRSHCQRRPARAHVVNHHDNRWTPSDSGLQHRPSASGVEASTGLGRSGPTTQQRPRWQPECTSHRYGQQPALIVAPAATCSWIGRNPRDDRRLSTRGAKTHGVDGDAERRGQGIGQTVEYVSPGPVLGRQQQRPGRLVVVVDGHQPIDPVGGRRCDRMMEGGPARRAAPGLSVPADRASAAQQHADTLCDVCDSRAARPGPPGSDAGSVG